MSDLHDDAIEALLRKQFDGAVPDDGFSGRVMQRLPAHRRHRTWPLWVGALAGTAACFESLLSAPLLHIGWRDWAGGELSASAIVLLSAIAGMSLLACWWSIAEADDR
ncbi:MAG TPA: hypothetical protein VGC19_09370 [Rhodanobacter sp.]